MSGLASDNIQMGAGGHQPNPPDGSVNIYFLSSGQLICRDSNGVTKEITNDGLSAIVASISSTNGTTLQNQITNIQSQVVAASSNNVRLLNGISGIVNISGGTNITITPIGNSLGISTPTPTDFGQNVIYNFEGNVVDITGTTVTLSQATHGGRMLKFSHSSGCTATAPSGLPLGFSVSWRQGTSGQITFSAGSGATINNRQSHTKSAGIHAAGAFFVDTINVSGAAVATLAGDTST